MVAVVLATAMVLAGCARGGQAQDCPRNPPPSVTGAQAQPAPPPPLGDASRLKVGVAYDVGGRGDASFNDAAGAGLDRASEQLTMPKATEATAQPGESEDAAANRLRRLVAQGDDPIIAVGFDYADAVRTVARENPRVRFAIVDDDTVTLPNVTPLVFADEQGSFLVGAAAALTTTTCKVGFVGGVDNPVIQKFAAGYVQGARGGRARHPGRREVPLPGGGLRAGSTTPPKGAEIASGRVRRRARTSCYAAAGSVRTRACSRPRRTPTRRPSASDSDQYDAPQLAPVQQVIMTSMIKRVDVAVYDYIDAVSRNDLSTLPERFDLEVDGVGYSTSGGQVDDIKPQLDAYKAAVISGRIQVK